MKVREKLEQMLRAQKRLRSGDSGDDGDRGKRRRGERVYKCRREKSGCIAVFASKEERDEHYKKVHNFVRTPGDANHQLRCPIADCVHRYPSKPKLEKHIREAHYLFAEVPPPLSPPYPLAPRSAAASFGSLVGWRGVSE